MEDKLLLPTSYISFTQWQMWLKSPERYKREYFEGEDKLDTKYLRFGKGAAEARERRELKEGEITELELKVEINGVPVLGYIDCYNSKEHYFEEEKTGKVPWTESKVQKWEQLPFYATLLKWKYGTMPDHCVLHWFETKDQDEDQGGLQNDIEFTGYEKEFRRDFDEREILRIEESIVKVVHEISESYKKYLENLDL